MSSLNLGLIKCELDTASQKTRIQHFVSGECIVVTTGAKPGSIRLVGKLLQSVSGGFGGGSFTIGKTKGKAISREIREDIDNEIFVVNDDCFSEGCYELIYERTIPNFEGLHSISISIEWNDQIEAPLVTREYIVAEELDIGDIPLLEEELTPPCIHDDDLFIIQSRGFKEASYKSVWLLSDNIQVEVDGIHLSSVSLDEFFDEEKRAINGIFWVDRKHMLNLDASLFDNPADKQESVRLNLSECISRFREESTELLRAALGQCNVFEPEWIQEEDFEDRILIMNPTQKVLYSQ